MGDDVRVVLIKLADRLHNMRTLGHVAESKRKRIAQQTLDIFAPLANRLGIWQIKWELEDLAFRYVNPERYKEIAEQLAERRPDRESQIEFDRHHTHRALRRSTRSRLRSPGGRNTSTPSTRRCRRRARHLNRFGMSAPSA